MVFPREQMFERSDGDQFKNRYNWNVFIMSKLQPPLAEMSCDSQKGDDSNRVKDEKLIPFPPVVDWRNLGVSLSQEDVALHS